MGKTLVIKQNDQIGENVDNTIVEKLYNLTYEDQSLNTDPQVTSGPNDIVGQIKPSGAYEDAVQFLATKFPNLTIDIAAGNRYIRFADVECENKLKLQSSLGGDGYGVTRNGASSASVSSYTKNLLYSAFGSNSNIRTIDLRPYTQFVGNGSDEIGAKFDLGTYSGCANLENIYIGGCQEFNVHGYTSHKTLNKLVIKDVYRLRGDTDSGYVYNTIAVKHVRERIGDYFFRGTTITNLYLGDSTPPTLTFGYSDQSRINSHCEHIYVPRGSISAYQNATNWSERTLFEEWDPADEDKIFEGM